MHPRGDAKKKIMAYTDPRMGSVGEVVVQVFLFWDNLPKYNIAISTRTDVQQKRTANLPRTITIVAIYSTN